MEPGPRILQQLQHRFLAGRNLWTIQQSIDDLMHSFAHISEFFAQVRLPFLWLMLTNEGSRTPSRLRVGFFSCSGVIGRTTIRQCTFLFTFESNQHLRGEWIWKRVQPLVFHDKVEVPQSRSHDTERTLLQGCLTS